MTLEQFNRAADLTEQIEAITDQIDLWERATEFAEVAISYTATRHDENGNLWRRVLVDFGLLDFVVIRHHTITQLTAKLKILRDEFEAL